MGHWSESVVTLQTEQFLDMVKRLQGRISDLERQVEAQDKMCNDWREQASLWHAVSGWQRDVNFPVGDRYPEKYPPHVELHYDYEAKTYVVTSAFGGSSVPRPKRAPRVYEPEEEDEFPIGGAETTQKPSKEEGAK